MGIDVHRVVQPPLLRQRHQAGDHVVVIRAGGVLGADGDLILRAGEVAAHTAHIHRQQLVQITGDGGAAVPHLFIDGEMDLHVIPGRRSGVPHQLQEGQQAGGGALVVDEPGLEEAALRHRRLGVKADIVSHLDAQGPHLFGVLHLLVNAHGHVLLVPGPGEHIVENMGGRGEGEDGAGINPSVPGVDLTVLPIQSRQDGAADPGDHQLPLIRNGPAHKPQRVHMGAQADPLGVFPAGHLDDQAALIGAARGVAQGARDPLRRRHRVLCESAGGIGGEQGLRRLHQKILAAIEIHIRASLPNIFPQLTYDTRFPLERQEKGAALRPLCISKKSAGPFRPPEPGKRRDRPPIRRPGTACVTAPRRGRASGTQAAETPSAPGSFCSWGR